MPVFQDILIILILIIIKLQVCKVYSVGAVELTELITTLLAGSTVKSNEILTAGANALLLKD